MRSFFAIAITFLSVSISGCGTMANLQGMEYMFISLPGENPVRVYGGVRKDIEFIAHNVRNPPIDDPIEVVVCGIPVVGFAIVDPVLSFVGDTITLPYVLSLKDESSPED